MLSGRSSFMSPNFRACVFSTSLAGIGGKAEASLNGAAFGVAGTVGSLLVADSSCARLLVAALTFAGVVGLGLLFCVMAAEGSSGTKSIALGGGNDSGVIGRELNVHK